MLRLVCIILFITLSIVKVRAQVNPYERMHRTLDSLVTLGIDSQAFPGAQIHIRYKDSVIYHRVWGHHTYNNERLVQMNDIYDLASITKVSTGLPVIMKLYGEGKLNIDAPLKNYSRDFKKSDKRNLTLRSVLAHQAGLVPYIVFWQNTLRKNGRYKCRTFKTSASSKFTIPITDSLFLHKKYVKKMKKAIRKSRLKPEGEYAYSGITFLLMPEILEGIVDGDFVSYLYDSIYHQIDAHDLVYQPLNNYNLERIIPTEHDSFWRKQLVHGTVHDEAAAMLNGVSCNAGLFGSASSLSNLFQLYLNKGKWKEEQIIPAQAIQIFTDYQYEDNRRGLGFDKPLREYDQDRSYIAKSASHASYGHSGFTGTMIWADPEYDLVFTFLSNRVYPSRDHRNLYKLSLRPQLHQAVYDYIIEIEGEVQNLEDLN